MTCFLRRLPLSRLLLLCGLVVVLGGSLTALAFALSTGPTPPPKPLADAVHDALTAAPVQGVSAQIQLTDHLLEGANLANEGSGAAGGLSSSPLLNGASGRLWIAGDGRVRLELQSENGDTEIYCDGQTVSMYDASSNTLYRLTLPAHAGGSGGSSDSGSSGSGSSGSGSSGSGSSTAPHEIPSTAKIEEAISHLSAHANISGATPTNIAGQPAYTVRVSPKEGGSLLGGAELSWDAVHGLPLRAAVYSSTNASSPVLELAATSISYGPVEPSVFAFTPPANATIEELVLPDHHAAPDDSTQGGEHPKLTSQGHGLSTVGVLESKVGHAAGTDGSGANSSSPALPEDLPQVQINGTPAAELTTELGTLLTFERSGVRYLLAGAVAPSAVEAVAKGL